MMLPRHTQASLIYITSKTIKVYDPTLPDSGWKTFDWDGVDLSEPLTLIRNHTNGPMRILVGADESYTGIICIPKKEISLESVIENVNKTVPFVVAEDCIDYKITSRVLNDKVVIQVFAIDEKFLDQLSTALHKNQLTVHSILPAASVFALETREDKNAHLVITLLPERMVVVAREGVVYGAIPMPDGLTAEVQEKIAEIAKKYEFTLSTVYLAGNAKESISFGEGWTEVPVEADLLSLIERFSRTRRHRRQWVVLVVLVLTGLGVGIVLLGGLPENIVLRKQVAEPVVEPTPLPTPEIVYRSTASEITVEVLNGIGVPGAAGSVVDIISSEEFAKIDAGNADEFTHEDTLINIKADVDPMFYDKLAGLLGNYTVVRGEDLSDEYEYDIRIITGVAK